MSATDNLKAIAEQLESLPDRLADLLGNQQGSGGGSGSARSSAAGQASSFLHGSEELAKSMSVPHAGQAKASQGGVSNQPPDFPATQSAAARHWPPMPSFLNHSEDFANRLAPVQPSTPNSTGGRSPMARDDFNVSGSSTGEGMQAVVGLLREILRALQGTGGGQRQVGGTSPATTASSPHQRGWNAAETAAENERRAAASPSVKAGVKPAR